MSRIMSSLHALLLLLSLFTHACNARHLGQHQLGNHETHASWSGAMAMRQVEAKALLKHEEETKGVTPVGCTGGISIDSILKSSPKEATKVEVKGLKTQARSMLGSTIQDAEETANYKKHKIAEETIVMDYAQPHWRPPVHNR